MKIKAGKHTYKDLRVYVKLQEILESKARIEFGVVSEDGTELEIATRLLMKGDLLTLDGMLVMVTIDRN